MAYSTRGLTKELQACSLTLELQWERFRQQPQDLRCLCFYLSYMLVLLQVILYNSAGVFVAADILLFVFLRVDLACWSVYGIKQVMVIMLHLVRLKFICQLFNWTELIIDSCQFVKMKCHFG